MKVELEEVIRVIQSHKLEITHLEAVEGLYIIKSLKSEYNNYLDKIITAIKQLGEDNDNRRTEDSHREESLSKSG